MTISACKGRKQSVQYIPFNISHLKDTLTTKVGREDDSVPYTTWSILMKREQYSLFDLGHLKDALTAKLEIEANSMPYTSWSI